MKIENYISQLLYRYQCVTVPNFGAFLTEIQSAAINETTATFSPPKKTVSFNSYLQNNDGLLANHISQVEKITYDEAVGSIKIQVLYWKEHLDLYGAVAVKNVGDFTLNSEKKLVFKPVEQLNYLTDSFGLTSCSFSTIERPTNITFQKIAAVDEPELAETSMQNLHDRLPIITLPLQKNNFNYLKYAAIFAIGLAVTGVYGYNFYENKIARDTVLVQTKVQKQVSEKIQEATFLITIPTEVVNMTIGTDKLPFHIVAGAFRSEKNADKELTNLLRKGFDAKRIEKNESGLYPVIYGSYASYSKAHEEMAKIKKHNPGAWVLIQE